MSVLTHLILLPSNERISIDNEGNEGVDYAAANALAFSLVSCATNGLLLHGIIKVKFTLKRVECNAALLFLVLGISVHHYPVVGFTWCCTLCGSTSFIVLTFTSCTASWFIVW